MPKSKVVFSTEQHEQSKVDHFMAFTRAQHKAHHAAMLNTLQHFDPHTGVVTMGANGTSAGATRLSRWACMKNLKRRFVYE